MKDIFKGKTILVTGGTGSFGKKFTKMLLDKYDPKKLIIFSRDEMKQWEMSKKFNSEKIRYFIGDVRDADRLHRAFRGVDIVVHAAAIKIVPTSEYNPFETVKTNIIGAENVINIAIDNDVQKVLALSTDKATNPINLYGATKLCSEKMFIAANNYSPEGTSFSVVRYGNVIGSRGSVIPFFKECRSKGIVPVTDKRMTRFWLTLESGVEFVLGCIEDMNGGEIYIPKIPSMAITDLVKAICPECKQQEIGIRPGEKLHEALISPDDGRYTYEFDDKFVILPNTVRRRCKVPSISPLGEGFEGYTSDKNDQWMTVDELKTISEQV